MAVRTPIDLLCHTCPGIAVVNTVQMIYGGRIPIQFELARPDSTLEDFELEPFYVRVRLARVVSKTCQSQRVSVAALFCSLIELAAVSRGLCFPAVLSGLFNSRWCTFSRL